MRSEAVSVLVEEILKRNDPTPSERELLVRVARLCEDRRWSIGDEQEDHP